MAAETPTEIEAGSAREQQPAFEATGDAPSAGVIDGSNDSLDREFDVWLQKCNAHLTVLEATERWTARQAKLARAWLARLASDPSLVMRWRRNRNRYAELLHAQLALGVLDEPFCRLPSAAVELPIISLVDNVWLRPCPVGKSPKLARIKRSVLAEAKDP